MNGLSSNHRVRLVAFVATLLLGVLGFAGAANAEYANTDYFWKAAPGSVVVIPVCWENPSAAPAERLGWVRGAIESSWQRYARVSFTEWDRCAAGDPGVHIQILTTGTSSAPGGVLLNGKTNGVKLNLYFSSSPGCVTSEAARSHCVRAIALHEFGHVLGFYHEEERPDYFAPPGTPSGAPCATQSWPNSSPKYYGPYDVDSVMSYCGQPFADPTTWKETLSPGDVGAVQRAYGAARSAGFGWAYLWGDVGTGTPNATFQFNSASPVVKNSVVRTGVGAYTVTLPNLDAPAGTVHVTAYGSGPATCKVASFYPAVSGMQVNVRCFGSGGVAADSQYTLTFTRPFIATKPMAYVWQDRPSAPLGTPFIPRGSYSFNSTDGTNTITHTGLGTYAVRLPNIGGSGGHVQVTAYGFGSERCKVVGWSPSGVDELVNVACFTSAGSPTDTFFTMTYARGISIVGSDCCPPGGPGTRFAYAWGNDASAASYTPSAPYQFSNPPATATITHPLPGSGAYAVSFPAQDLSRGTVQVTAYGSGPEYCKVAYWTPSAGVKVSCFGGSGTALDTRYVVTFASSYLIG